jgi:CheY-like chemotaxis protein
VWSPLFFPFCKSFIVKITLDFPRCSKPDEDRAGSMIVRVLPEKDAESYFFECVHDGPGRIAMKVLIVEDNAGVRHLLKSILAFVASETCECSDGADALAAYKLNRPDVVLMDIQMGEVDGIMAAESIVGVDPAAKVIMVTDYDQPDLREAARRAGARGYVLKENLLELVPLLESL